MEFIFDSPTVGHRSSCFSFSWYDLNIKGTREPVTLHFWQHQEQNLQILAWGQYWS